MNNRFKRPHTAAELNRQVDKFNQTHKIGDTVIYHPIIGEDAGAKPYKLRSAAFVLSGHTAVTFLENKAGCVALQALTDPHETEAA